MNPILLDIDPIAFRLGFLEVRWYGIMVVLAVLSIIAITLLEAKRVGISQDHVYSLGVWAVIGGILGSRLVHVIDRWDYYIAHPRQIITFEGLAVYGAVIGILLAVIIYVLVNRYSFLKKQGLRVYFMEVRSFIWQLGDIIAPGALVGMAIGRIGCLINGCCYGEFSSLPWAIIYGNPGCYAPLGVPVHPAPVYHILWNLTAFAIIWGLRRRLKPQGSLFLLYLALYAVGDLGIRFIREGEPFLFGMQQAQLIGVIVLLITVPWLIIRMWRAKGRISMEESAGEVIGPDQNRGG